MLPLCYAAPIQETIFFRRSISFFGCLQGCSLESGRGEDSDGRDDRELGQLEEGGDLREERQLEDLGQDVGHDDVPDLEEPASHVADHADAVGPFETTRVKNRIKI